MLNIVFALYLLTGGSSEFIALYGTDDACRQAGLVAIDKPAAGRVSTSAAMICVPVEFPSDVQPD